MIGSAGISFLRCSQILIESKDPYALKIPARRAEYSLTESAFSPFQAEPTQGNKRVAPCPRISGLRNSRDTLWMSALQTPTSRDYSEEFLRGLGDRSTCQ